MPELFEEGLWPAQIVAIRNLERSLSQHRPSALIKMATGSGKTFSDFRAVRASQDGNTDIGLDFG
jgi:type I site-specific restriction endonuclease